MPFLNKRDGAWNFQALGPTMRMRALLTMCLFLFMHTASCTKGCGSCICTGVAHVNQEHLQRRQLSSWCRGCKGVAALGVGADVKLQRLCLGKGLVARLAASPACELEGSTLGQGSTGSSTAIDSLPLCQQERISGVVGGPVPAWLDAVTVDGLADKSRDRPARKCKDRWR